MSNTVKREIIQVLDLNGLQELTLASIKASYPAAVFTLNPEYDPGLDFSVVARPTTKSYKYNFSVRGPSSTLVMPEHYLPSMEVCIGVLNNGVTLMHDGMPIKTWTASLMRINPKTQADFETISASGPNIREAVLKFLYAHKYGISQVEVPV